MIRILHPRMVLYDGLIGNHSLAVLAVRDGLAFIDGDIPIKSNINLMLIKAPCPGQFQITVDKPEELPHPVLKSVFHPVAFQIQSGIDKL